MDKTRNGAKGQPRPSPPTVIGIAVGGYKSIRSEQSIEIRPLTILAGANSSGKSSIVQPLLLLKQTLEAGYDPGPLLLNGPNAKFTSFDQVLWRTSRTRRSREFKVVIKMADGSLLSVTFGRQILGKEGLFITETIFEEGNNRLTLRPGMTYEAILATTADTWPNFYEFIKGCKEVGPKWAVVRRRCFLDLAVRPVDNSVARIEGMEFLRQFYPGLPNPAPLQHVREMLHVPGLRGNPERTYPVTAVESAFPGTFEKYVASVIAQWQQDKSGEKLDHLGRQLHDLGLTSMVVASPVNETQVELHVGRTLQASRSGAADLVSIADVGFGVSQSLPVLVALLVAKPTQLVYLEQPELHLHPRAQSAMAGVVAEAAMRGARVIVETHSGVLLLGIQALVAEGKLPADLVKLHWFQRREDGVTRVTSADLDEAGAFGDWPEDFGEVALKAESRYLDAVESRHQRS